ncbi:MAG: RimJ/RimL family protein N-acetyltransferase [Hyphomicrobiaceae bacterium]|jgi:N-acetyltransferase
MSWPPTVTLEGKIVAVAPLTQAHAQDLAEASADGGLERLWYTTIPAPEDVAGDIDKRNALANMCPFAVVEQATGKAVGMTTYLNVDEAHRRVEIGGTWYRKAVQRSGLNTECKFLLLRHAFETLNCNVVEFRTHFINYQSRNAIERLGAKFDGILRNHMIMPNGTLRDTAVYSIIAPEWSTVKTHLEWQMARPR